MGASNITVPSQGAAPQALIDLATNAKADTDSATTRMKARAVATSLAAYTAVGGVITANANGALGAQDGVTLVAGDVLFVPKNAAAAGADVGPYVVTSVGGAGPFILTRPSWWADGAAIVQGAEINISGEAGTKWAGSRWKVYAAKSKVVDTDDPVMYPSKDKGVSGNMTGTPGAITVSNLYIASNATVLITRCTSGGTLGNLKVAAADITAGNGTGSFIAKSDANETSTMNYCVENN